MATIKSYTDLEQSKKLAEILPLESADMYYSRIDAEIDEGKAIAEVLHRRLSPIDMDVVVPAWSLSVLIDILPEEITYETENLDEWEDYKFFFLKENGEYYIGYEGYNDKQDFISVSCEYLVDACYEMILKLHELNLL